MATAATPLQYGRSPCRRLPWVRILIVLMVLGVAGVGWRYRQVLGERYRMYSLQRQCMNYTAPPDLIAYEEDEVRGNALVKRDSGYRQNYSHEGFRTGVWPMEGTFRPVLPWEKLDAALPKQTSVFGGRTVIIATRYPPCATIFLHARRCKGGEERLVVAELQTAIRGVSCHILRPGSCGQPPVELNPQPSSGILYSLLWQPYLFANGGANGTRFFFGQPDPDDESRFAIRASVDGVDITLVGNLQLDDTVRLEIPGGDKAMDKLKQPRPPANK